MILLFTAIFSTISIIEDRREGFLQSVLVAPVPRMAIVLGKVLGGTRAGVRPGAALPAAGARWSASARRLAGFALALLLMLVLAFALTALGFCIAWRMSSTQGFHAIMNLFLMPMWFLSGALFPAEGAWAGCGGSCGQPAQLRPGRPAAGDVLGTPTHRRRTRLADVPGRQRRVRVGMFPLASRSPRRSRRGTSSNGDEFVPNDG